VTEASVNDRTADLGRGTAQVPMVSGDAPRMSVGILVLTITIHGAPRATRVAARPAIGEPAGRGIRRAGLTSIETRQR